VSENHIGLGGRVKDGEVMSDGNNPGHSRGAPAKPLWPDPKTPLGQMAESAIMAGAIGYVLGLSCGVLTILTAFVAEDGADAPAAAWRVLTATSVFSFLGAVVFAALAGGAVGLNAGLDWLCGRLRPRNGGGRTGGPGAGAGTQGEPAGGGDPTRP
jgi:hypothetical protein